MDLFELSAKLKLDDSGYTKGINNAMAAGEKLKGSMSAMTVAVGQLAADAMRKGISAISGVVTGAIDGYANYQQLIGGVETLFKSSASKVSAYAKQAYKTTGLSANDYMETVTSFSASLLQGLGGDTEAAADLANTAITDMADNANKMGTDISSIQAAYQGFAKQNYTMLDNLKLGYGGTKGEMVRLINDSGILEDKIDDLDGITFDQLIQAIHKIQEEMGVTGTTASEAASTISGSKASVEAAWDDLLTAVGGEGNQARLEETVNNFKSSFDTYVNTNLFPAIESTLKRAPKLIEAVTDSITTISPWKMIQIIKSIEPIFTTLTKGISKVIKNVPGKAVAEAALGFTGIIEGAADAAKSITEWIVSSLTTTIQTANADPQKIKDMGAAVGEFVGSTLADIWDSLPTVIPGLFQAGVNFAGSLIDGLISGLTGMDEGLYGEFKDADKEMAESITEAEKTAAQAHAVVDYMSGLVDKYGQAAKNTEEWAAATERLQAVMPNANTSLRIQNGRLESNIGYLNAEIEALKEKAILQAREKALNDKEEAYQAAIVDLETAKGSLEFLQSQKSSYNNMLLGYIRKYNTAAQMKDEKGNYIYSDEYYLNGEDGKNLATTAHDSLVYQSGLDPNSKEYNDALRVIDGYAEAMLDADTEIQALEESMSKLERQVTYAETQLQIAEATFATLTQSAGKAADVLGSIKAPKWFSSGEPGVFGKGGEIYTPKATGIDYVPENGYRAELHRGEGILTAAQNAERRNGAGNAEVVGAIQQLRNDLQNLKLVVGRKTFGRAVVDYGGSMMEGYIGRSDSALASGYGA